MSMHSKSEEIKGKTKLAVGKMTDNDSLKAKGQIQKTSAKIDQTLEKGDRKPHTDKHDQPTL